MDPNATLKLIADCLASGDHDGAHEAAENLREWLAKGGFAPDWTAYPDAAKYVETAKVYVVKATLKQIAIEFGDRAFDEEIEHYRRERPAQLAKVSPEELDAYRAKVREKWVGWAGEMTNHETLFARLASGMLHPSNKNWRAMFKQLTGVSLPATMAGTREAVRQFIGAETFDRMGQLRDADRERAQQEKHDKIKADAAARMSKIIAEASDRVRAGDYIDGDTLVTLCRHLGIEVHPRTVSMLRKRVRSISAEQARIVGRDTGPMPYRLYQQCAKKLAVVENSPA